MDFFLGVITCLTVEAMGWATVVVWRRLTSPGVTPQPPRTAAQLANERVFDELERTTPRVVSLRLRRRTMRGRQLRNVEREEGTFE